MDPLNQMDPMSQIVVLNIGHVVAWLAAIYLRDALRTLPLNIVICATGAFLGGLATEQIFPALDKPGMVFGAFAGAVLLLSMTRPITGRLFRNGQ